MLLLAGQANWTRSTSSDDAPLCSQRTTHNSGCGGTHEWDVLIVSELDDRAHFVIERLVELSQTLTTLTAEEGPGIARLLAAYGWWTRSVRTANAIGLLHRSGLAHEASPLVRTLLHHAVALKWLEERPSEALPALAWEHRCEGNRMLNKALERAWDLDPTLALPPAADKPPTGYKYLKNTEELCERVDMSNAYVAFLSESKFTHPTAISADAYLGEVDGKVVLLQDAGAHTPLRGAALIAADSTARFASLVGLPDIDAEAAALRDSLIGSRNSDTPT